MKYNKEFFTEGQVLYHDSLNNIINGIEQSIVNGWEGKTIAFWGDSVTAAAGGDYNEPFSPSSSWPQRVASNLKCSNIHVRGIGGQTFKWGSKGGSVSFVYENTGILQGRKDGQNFDEYNGEIPSGCIKTRGCGCSYHRIASMFPETIRNNIDCVFMIYHNDAAVINANEKVVWESNSTSDPEWANSPFYSTYGGDFNISTTAGAIASTIMKMQAVLPNAKVVLGTPVAGRGNVGELNPDQSVSELNNVILRETVLKVGAQFSTPVIDVFGTCGINGLNRNIYIYDGIHPNKYGHAMMGEAVANGLKLITPLPYTNRTPNDISGSVIISNSTVSQSQQGIEGFKPGETYKYIITPEYTGNLTLYHSYYDYTKGTGWSVDTSKVIYSQNCVKEQKIEGTFTVPIDVDGKSYGLICIRTHTADKVKVDYEFTII